MNTKSILSSFFLFITFIVLSIAIGFFIKKISNYEGAFLISVEITFLILIIVSAKKWKIDIFGSFRKIEKGNLFFVFFLGILITLIYPILNIPDFINHLSRGEIGIMKLDIDFNNSITYPINKYYYIRLILIMPLLEELFYRGIIQHKLRKKNSMFVSIFVSSLLFGLGHPNLEQFSYTFIGGLIVGSIYDKSKNLSLTVLLHIIINFSVVLIKINYTFESKTAILFYHIFLISVILVVMKKIISKKNYNYD